MHYCPNKKSVFSVDYVLQNIFTTKTDNDDDDGDGLLLLSNTMITNSCRQLNNKLHTG